jgi:hypothetical protein
VEEGFELDGRLETTDEVADAALAAGGKIGPAGDGGFGIVFAAATDHDDDRGSVKFGAESFGGFVKFALGDLKGLNGFFGGFHGADEILGSFAGGEAGRCSWKKRVIRL